MTKPLQLKKELDRVNDILKHEAQTLSRLRHPSMLEVTEPLSDSSTVMAFATEPVLCNLSNVLGNFRNFSPPSQEDFKRKYELDELEIQKGILQLVKALQFLHSNRIIHGNICPESININAKGDWKVAGFNFAITLTSGSEGSSDVNAYINNFPPYCAPSLDYLAPEYVFDEKCDATSDVWSLGCLIYALINKGESLVDARQNLYSFRQAIEKGSFEANFGRGNAPTGLKDLIRAMVKRYPHHRITIPEIQNSAYFDNILISTIKFLDSFVEKTQIEKAQFLKGLTRVLPQFSERLISRKILPSLLNELKDKLMCPFLLPNIFLISDNLSEKEFTEMVLPSLKQIFRLTDPPQSMMLLLSRMDLFLKKCSSAETFRQEIMPLLYTALELPVPHVQEQALKAVNAVLEKLEFSSIKSVLLLKIQSLYTTSQVLSIRINALIAIHSMIKTLDKFTLTEKILPILKHNRTREPGLMMACLAVYEEVAKHLDKESLAQEVLPELWKMALDTQLSLNQFKKFMKNINDLTRRVEELHSKHLETLNNIEGIQKIGDTMQDFEKLVNHSTGVGRQPIAPPVKTADFMSDFDPPTLSPRASVTTGATFTATTVSSNYTRPISYTPPSNSSAFNASTSNGHRASSFGQVSPHNNNNNTAANQNFNLYFGSSPAFPTTATSASTSNFAAFNSTVAQPQTLSSMGSFGSGTQPQSNVRKPNSNMAKEFDPFN